MIGFACQGCLLRHSNKPLYLLVNQKTVSGYDVGASHQQLGTPQFSSNELTGQMGITKQDVISIPNVCFHEPLSFYVCSV